MTRTDELLAAARRIADALPPGVTDIVLTGSVSRGVADDLSDIELLVVSEEPPGELPLEDVERWQPPVEGAAWIGGMFDGEFVELVWWTPSHADERVRGIAAGEVVDWQGLKTAEAIVSGIPLRGGRRARWTAQLEPYPEGLTEKIVADASGDWLEPTRCYRALYRPGDSLMRAWRAATDAENILRIVFAANEEWPPGWKRLAQRVEPLALKPARLAERLDAAVRELDLVELRRLAVEALALVPQTERTAKALRLLEEPL